MAEKSEYYWQSEDVYASLAQAFQDVKHQLCDSVGKNWNVSVQDVQGVNLKLVGNDHVLINYQCFQMSTPQILEHKKLQIKAFLDEIVKELKKKFKQNTKTVLKLKKVKEDEGTEKYSPIYGETSFASLGGPPRYVSSMVGKYTVKVGRLYQFDTALKDE